MPLPHDHDPVDAFSERKPLAELQHLLSSPLELPSPCLLCAGCEIILGPGEHTESGA